MGEPCCHACGGPIEIRKPVDIYHPECDVWAAAELHYWMKRVHLHELSDHELELFRATANRVNRILHP